MGLLHKLTVFITHRQQLFSLQLCFLITMALRQRLMTLILVPGMRHFFVEFSTSRQGREKFRTRSELIFTMSEIRTARDEEEEGDVMKNQ
jgi:hypothetical protein